MDMEELLLILALKHHIRTKWGSTFSSTQNVLTLIYCFPPKRDGSWNLQTAKISVLQELNQNVELLRQQTALLLRTGGGKSSVWFGQVVVSPRFVSMEKYSRLQICPLYIFGNNPPQMVPSWI